VVSIAHNNGGVGKTTSTVILSRYLSHRWREQLRDYDETAHLTDLVADLAPKDRTTVSRRLWLDDGTSRSADIVLVDSPPARGRRTRVPTFATLGRTMGAAGAELVSPGETKRSG
jgi:hypothetical protein